MKTTVRRVIGYMAWRNAWGGANGVPLHRSVLILDEPPARTERWSIWAEKP